MNIHLPSKVMMFVWDMFLFYGWRALISVILTILFLTKGIFDKFHF